MKYNRRTARSTEAGAGTEREQKFASMKPVGEHDSMILEWHGCYNTVDLDILIYLYIYIYIYILWKFQDLTSGTEISILGNNWQGVSEIISW